MAKGADVLAPWRAVTSVAPEPAAMATDLAPAGQYRFRARAHNEQGWSGWSPESELLQTKRRF